MDLEQERYALSMIFYNAFKRKIDSIYPEILYLSDVDTLTGEYCIPNNPKIKWYSILGKRYLIDPQKIGDVLVLDFKQTA